MKKIRILTFAQRPPWPRVGDQVVFTDATSSAWGAVVAGGGANRVLAWWNGVSWTVTGC